MTHCKANARFMANESMVQSVSTFDDQIYGGFKIYIGICIPKGNYKRAPSLKFTLKSLRWVLVRLLYIDEERLVDIISKLQLVLTTQFNDFVAAIPKNNKNTTVYFKGGFSSNEISHTSPLHCCHGHKHPLFREGQEKSSGVYAWIQSS